jgi:membrane dipeptidase
MSRRRLYFTCKYSVGLGSDYDGIPSTPAGLEDVSKYPQLVAELRRRNWSRRDLAGLAGANLLRILEKAENVARRMHFEEHKGPDYALYDLRPDIPVRRKGSDTEL